MIKRLDHLVITTNNLSECIKFYEILGFESRNDSGKHELYCSKFKINVHQRGNELLPHATHVQAGSADLCFEIDVEVKQCINTLKLNGIELLEGPVTRRGFKGTMQSIYVVDPDGNLIELSNYNK